MHYDKPPQENQPFKSREEQDADFAFLAEYADKNCPTCFGTAKNGFNTETQMYVVCNCVVKNIHSALAEQNKAEVRQDGILQTILRTFGRN